MSSKSPLSFGSILRRRRIEAGLTQEELAERAGISARAVSDIERGLRQRVYPDTIAQLADALDLAGEEFAAFERAARPRVGRPGRAAESDASTGAPNSGTGGRQRLPIGGFAGSLASGALVGRHAEMERLLGAVAAVEQEQGRLVLLAGEPGSGKTRLLQEATAAALERGFLVAAGRCYEPEQGVPYYPFLDALAALWDAAPASARTQAQERWPYLGALLPDEVAVPPPTESPGQDDQRRVFRSATGFLDAMAALTPLAVLLDDLHWADGSSLKLLRHIANHTRSCRLLLLGAYRDVEVGRHHPLEAALLDLRREGLVETIPIRRLPPEGTAALVAAAMGGNPVPAAFAERLHARTEGNPFFTKQVLDVLLQGTDRSKELGRLDHEAIERIEIPESIRAVVGRRLSRLSAETQTILHEAGVLGQRFRFGDLQAMTGRDEEAIETALAEACEQRVLAETGKDEYGFDHVLTQQVLDAELPARRKRRLHLAAGEMLERLPDARRSDHFAEIAWHFREADVPEKAMRYALAAGDHAAQVFAHDEAEQQYRTVLGLARELAKRDDETDVLEKLSRVLQRSGRYDEALAVLEDAVAIHHQAGNLAREIEAVISLSLVHYYKGNRRDSIAAVDAFLDALDSRDPPPGTARLYFFKSALATSMQSGKVGLAGSLAETERAAVLARAEGDTRTEILAETHRGYCLRCLGRDDEAVQVLQAAALLAREQGTTDDSLQVLILLAETYLWTGRLEQARTQFEHNRAHYRRLGNSGLVAYCTAHLGASYFANGDWRRARSCYAEALQLRQAESPFWGEILTLARFGELAFREGKWAEAQLLLDEGMMLARENQDPQWLFLLHELLIERDLLRGRAAAALRCHERLMADPEQAEKLSFGPSSALAMTYLAAGYVDRAGDLIEQGIEVRGEDGPDLNLWVWIALRARVLAARESWDESEAAFLDAIARARRTRYVFYEARVLQWHGEMLAAKGDTDRAREWLQAATEVYARLGAAPYLAQTDAVRERLEAQQSRS